MPLAESRQGQWPWSCACLRYLRLPSSGHSAWAVPGPHRARGGHSPWWPWSSARRRQEPSFSGTLASGSTTSAGERDRAQEGGGERKVLGPHTLGERWGHTLTRVLAEAASGSASGNAVRSAAGLVRKVHAGNRGPERWKSLPRSPVRLRPSSSTALDSTRERCRSTPTALSKPRTTPQDPAGGNWRSPRGVDLRSPVGSSAWNFRTTPPATTIGFTDAESEAVHEHRRVSDPPPKSVWSQYLPLSSSLLGSITLTG